MYFFSFLKIKIKLTFSSPASGVSSPSCSCVSAWVKIITVATAILTQSSVHNLDMVPGMGNECKTDWVMCTKGICILVLINTLDQYSMECWLGVDQGHQLRASFNTWRWIPFIHVIQITWSDHSKVQHTFTFTLHTSALLYCVRTLICHIYYNPKFETFHKEIKQCPDSSTT